MINTETPKKDQPLRILDLGLRKYRPVLELQLSLRDKVRTGQTPNTILLLEHLPVITLGARKTANRLVNEVSCIEKNGIDVVDIRRGGGATAHNPGQIVFYPIINLAKINLGISQYIRLLEQIGIELLQKLSVEAHRKKGFPGLWTETKKIASIGVRVSKKISYHGMAINIKNDLNIFDNMIPCGLDGVIMTSAEKITSKKYDMKTIKKVLTAILIQHFSSQELTSYEDLSQTPELA